MQHFTEFTEESRLTWNTKEHIDFYTVLPFKARKIEQS